MYRLLNVFFVLYGSWVEEGGLKYGGGGGGGGGVETFDI